MRIYLDHNLPFDENKIKSFEDFEIVSNAELADIIISPEPSNFFKFKAILISFSHENNILNLDNLKNSNYSHLIGKSDQLEQELMVTLLKILHHNYFGIEKFLNDDALIVSKEITHSKEINEVIDDLLERFDFSDTFDSPKDNLRIILNEFATNAFFHQEQLYDTNRKNSIFTTKPISIALAKDSERIVAYVKDNIGTIKKTQLIDSIIRGFKERAPRLDGHGAGLGLYMVFENLNQLHINKKNEVFCEFIGIIDISKRYKKFKERITSFHYFEE